MGILGIYYTPAHVLRLGYGDGKTRPKDSFIAGNPPFAQMSDLGYNRIYQLHKVATAMRLTSGGLADSLRRTNDMHDDTSSVSARGNSTKLCTRCKQIRSVTDFLPHKGSKDGLRVWCNFCLVPDYQALKFQHPNEEFTRCGKCQQWKPKSRFAKDSSLTRGVSNTCKECRSEWSKENSEYLTGKATEWQRNNPERARATVRAWEEKNPEKVTQYRNTTIGRYPERARARQAVRSAVYLGKLPPAWTMVCEGCQEALAAHWHHHRGYAEEFQLDVIALCATCHGQEHRMD